MVTATKTAKKSEKSKIDYKIDSKLMDKLLAVKKHYDQWPLFDEPLARIKFTMER